MRRDLSAAEFADILHTLNRVETEFQAIVGIILSHDIAIKPDAQHWRPDPATGCRFGGGRRGGAGLRSRYRRAAGQPYAAYDRVKFSVPVYPEGDVLARIRVPYRRSDAVLPYRKAGVGADRARPGMLRTAADSAASSGHRLGRVVERRNGALAVGRYGRNGRPLPGSFGDVQQLAGGAADRSRQYRA